MLLISQEKELQLYRYIKNARSKINIKTFEHLFTNIFHGSLVKINSRNTISRVIITIALIRNIIFE